jgi:hypothetical protein
MQTLHQSKCHESKMRARRATQSIARKTQKKQEATRKKLRKKTWGF